MWEEREEREKRAKAAHGEECGCLRELKQSVGQLKQYAEQLRRDMEEKAVLRRGSDSLSSELEESRKQVDLLQEQLDMLQCEATR